MFRKNGQGQNIWGRSGDDIPLPLSRIQSGQRVEIVDLDAGRDFQIRLESMGVFPGCETTVLTNHDQGPVLVALGDNRIMLGRGMAEKIIVQICKNRLGDLL